MRLVFQGIIFINILIYDSVLVCGLLRKMGNNTIGTGFELDDLESVDLSV